MTQGFGWVDSVGVTAADFANFDIAGLVEVIDYRSGVTFCDAYEVGQLGYFYFWLPCDLHDDVAVVTQEGPAHDPIIAAFLLRYYFSCIVVTMNSIDIALSSLTSVPVLAFALGILASRLKSDLSISKGAFDAISFVLLLAIGLKGGFALQKSGLSGVAVPVLVTLLLGAVIPMIAFVALRVVKKLSIADRGSIAAHYGSTSLVTFTAAIVFLDAAQIKYEGFVTTLLVVMEIPGILVGILLARGGVAALRDKELLREVFFGKTVLLLLGGVLLGFVSGPKGYESVKTLFVDAQPGLLTLFLLTLGIQAGTNLKQFRSLGIGLVAFAFAMPLVGGTLGALAGAAIGLSAGGATALAVLCASASYIAAPAAVSIALPKANNSFAITASLGLTFPFNLIVGLPLYYYLASMFTGLF